MGGVISIATLDRFTSSSRFISNRWFFTQLMKITMRISFWFILKNNYCSLNNFNKFQFNVFLLKLIVFYFFKVSSWFFILFVFSGLTTTILSASFLDHFSIRSTSCFHGPKFPCRVVNKLIDQFNSFDFQKSSL